MRWLCLLPLVLLAAAALAGCGGHPRSSPPSPATTAPQAATTIVAPSPQPPGAIVATAKRHVVDVYPSQSSRRRSRRLVSPGPDRTPLVFLVRRRVGRRDEVYLPLRPDGTTGWIDERDVTLTLDAYSVHVSLSRHLLVLERGGKVVERLTAGVGGPQSRTPTGTFYVVDLLQQPDPEGPYGPYAFGLSGFSHMLYHFGGGPGQIAIHGTDDPTSVGEDESQGCIRLANTQVARLARILPLGTPVHITS